MKKDFILKALTPQLDASIEAEISAILRTTKRYPGKGIYEEHECSSTITPSLEVIGYFDMIHDIERSNFKDVTKVMIFDYGCGIGNVLSLLTSLVREDKTMFPNLSSIRAIGVEKVLSFIESANIRVNKITPLNNLIYLDINHLLNKSVINPGKTNFLNLRGGAYGVKSQFEIHFCSRVFRDIELQTELEQFIFKATRVNGYVILPGGAIQLPKSGIKVINNRLIKVVGDVVFK